MEIQTEGPTMVSVQQAFAVLDKIEYSGDGFVKRYPTEDEYEDALNFLKKKLL